ncbi:MAG: UbiA family prenyltransferase, partial [Bacteroidales bacterium]|nr:UbiA family prenyltransferase [Bacteroidales bacterium]
MKDYLSLVKFSHTVFAMPFAFTGFALGVTVGGKSFSWQILVLVVLCMIFARNAAMGFNRIADRYYDALNPRTSSREIPSGKIDVRSATFFVVINSILFIVSAGLINRLTLILSPVALAIILGYSLTKRFTLLCHFILGLGLSLAPVGAYISVTGKFHTLPVLFSLLVISWVSGFDIIYSLQDDQFGRENRLMSI